MQLQEPTDVPVPLGNIAAIDSWCMQQSIRRHAIGCWTFLRLLHPRIVGPLYTHSQGLWVPTKEEKGP